MSIVSFDDIDKIIKYTNPRTAMMWHGPPGCGKSQFALSHPTLQPIVQFGLATRQPEDTGGCPFPDKERKVTEFFPVEEFWRYVITDANPDPGGCIFFDEYDKGREEQQVAVMRILSERTLAGGHRIGPRVRIIVAGNRRQDQAGSYHDMPRVIRNRLRHFEIRPSFPYWRKHYAEEDGKVHPLVVLFLERNQDWFSKYDPNTADWGFATARSWTSVSDAMYSQDAGLDPALVYHCIVGDVGPGAAAAFDEFRKYISEIPPIEELAAGKHDMPPRDRPDHWVALSARCVAHAEAGLLQGKPDHTPLKDVAKVLLRMEDASWQLLLATQLNRRKSTRKLWVEPKVVGPEVAAKIGTIYHKIREAELSEK